MRKTITLLFAALLCVLFVAPPQSVSAKDAPEEADFFALFRVAGRKWTLKRTPKPGNEGGDTGVTYHQFEILSVWDDHAEMTQTSLDEGKKAAEGAKFVIKVEFKKDNLIFKDPIGFKEGKTEKVKTDAGTFECTVWSSLGREDGDAYIWRSNDFPGLIVKQDDRFGTRELESFSWVDGDPGYKSTKKRKKGDKNGATETVDPKRLFSTKGAQWIVRSDTKRGERGTRSIEVTQYEVKKTSDEQCELEVSKLTQLLQKMKGEDPQTLIIKFDSTFEDNLQPKERAREDRVERRITEVGLFTCTVYSFKDDDGRQGMAWYAQEWPGLVVRRVITGDDYEQITEIIKFEE